MPRTGTYRHKITIQTPDETVDAYGQAIKSWSTHAQVFAAVEPLRGRELFASAQYNVDISVRVRLHYLSTVTEKMRISWGGKIYNILSIINPSERDREMHLMCSEGLNDG